jgi:outer membrane receptor protein involved in Fe transport
MLRGNPSVRTTTCMSLIAATLVSQTSAAFAQQASEEEELALAYGDKSTVSIATGSRQTLRRAPAVATVITAQDIAAMGAVDLDEVLETVPGIHVSRNNQAYNPLYVIRGIFSELNPQTLMLQNGVPMTTLLVGNRGIGWGGLPVENIARIEIIRGPGSALYGADAYSGVINIITKTAADTPGTEFGLRAGSFQSRDGWVQHGGKLGAVDVAGYLRLGHTDGFKEIVAADAQTALDTLFGSRASLAPGPVNTGYDAVDASLDLGHDKLRLRAGYKLRDHIGTGAGISGALDPVGKVRTERLTADVSWSDVDIAKDWRMSLTASYFHYVQDFNVPLQLFPPGAFGGAFPDGMIGAPHTWERQLRLSAVTIYSGFANHNLRFGAGHDDLNMYRTQEFKNFTGLPIPTPGAEVIEFPVENSFLAPQRRTVTYVYAQDEWNLARDWTLTGGIRRDQYSDFGGTTNPRVALVWDATLDLTAKLLYGRAFRAPAFAEQRSINNPVIRGNPNLQPETIKTLEAAFAWQARADTQVNLSLFRYRMNDIIRAEDVAGGTKMFNNVGTQRGHGMELEAIWNASRSLRLAGHHAYQRSIDETSDQDAGYAPHHHLFARADWSFSSGWLFSGQVNRVADRRRAAGDLRPDIADYTTVDLTLRTGRGKGRWDFAASVRNLFNADVREPTVAPGVAIPNDLPMAPRSVYLQAIYRL